MPMNMVLLMQIIGKLCHTNKILHHGISSILVTVEKHIKLMVMLSLVQESVKFISLMFYIS